MNIQLSEDTFGILLPYIKNKHITDIRWDGSNLWLDDLRKGKYMSKEKLDDKFINLFTQRLADSTNASFNASCPVLEGETDRLRIACIHSSITNTGTAITIRKSEPICRLNDQTILETHYCSEEVLDLLKKLVKARCSIIVTGDTGSGKTELIKYLMQYIDDKTTTLTVEDNYELRAKSLRPEFDCTEIKVTSSFPPSAAIKASLRQNTKWLILSEARSKEALNLIEAASTGCSTMTTIHSWDVRNIPERFESMIGKSESNVKNDVYSFFDVGILIIKKETSTGFERCINQICFFTRDNEENKIEMLMDEDIKQIEMPKKIRKKFHLYNVDNPIIFEEIK